MESLVSPESVVARVKSRLSFPLDGKALEAVLPRDDHTLDGPSVPAALSTGMQRAAVLVGLAAYPGEVRVIFTQRTVALRVHSGPVAFPSSKIEARDKSPAAALREAQEEIGLAACHAEPLGYLDPYPAGTGFPIVPVLAKVAAHLAFKINPDEVDEAFEVPFAFRMNAANHTLRHEELDEKLRHFHAMPYGAPNIWGVTAGILRNLYERLYS